MNRPLLSRADPNPGFRPDIAGLRAVAVMIVILFHFGVSPFKGGFVGVDVFFVISGFLMTGIIGDRVAKDRWHLRSFYWTRLMRIYPPMLALLALLLAAGFRFLSPDEYVLLGKHSLAALASLANFIFATETGYFAPARETNWLLHLWSLSVEMQFYLFFPVILVFLLKHDNGRRVMPVLLVLFAASLFASALVTRYDAPLAFFHLPTRLWEFLAGSIGFFLGKRRLPLPDWLLPLFGLCLVIAAACLFRPEMKFPSYRALLPVAGAAIIVMNSSHLFLLANPVSRFLGDISYSLYLWHWPVWVAARHYNVAATPGLTALLLLLSIALGTVSYYGIERPSDRLRHRDASRALRLSFPFAICLCAILAGGIAVLHGLPQRAPALVRDVWSRYSSDYATIARPQKGLCFRSPNESFDKFPPLCFGASEPASDKAVLVWGDSYADHIWSGLARTPSLTGIPIMQATAASCPPLLGTNAPTFFNPACPELNRHILEAIAQKRPRTIVLYARWQYYDQHDTDVAGGLRDTVENLKGLGAEVVLIGPNPEWLPTLQQFAFQRAFLHGGYIAPRAQRPIPDPEATLDRRLAALAQQTGIRYVSLFDLLCNGDGCLIQIGEHDRNELVEYDFGHLTIPAAEWVADRIFPQAGKGSAQ